MEIREIVDQQTHRALALLAARPDLFMRQGSFVGSMRRRGLKTYGPYYRLAFRDGGRQHSIYLGPAGELVERVRGKLEQLQQPLRQVRAIDRFCRSIAATVRIDKLRVDAMLRPYGLRMKGFEIRGWRISPLRGVLALYRPKGFRISGLRTVRLRLKTLSLTRRTRKTTAPHPPETGLPRFLDTHDRAASPH